ncbi:retrovirus-related pol polyprotein from transposon TNT 1-94, partial [Tanacetum coccineum]
GVIETISSVPRIESTASKSSKDSLEQPKDVRPSAPIIEEWESNSDDDCVIRPSFEQNKPSYAKINFVKSDENTRKSVIEQHTYRQAENLRKSQSPRVDKINWNEIMTRKLGDGFKFNKKACFVCGSLNHLIKDCNFYENKMVGKSVLNNMGRVTGQREVRPVQQYQGDDLLYYDKPMCASRAKKIEKSHDPLALVAHTGLSSKNTSSYYVTHPSSVVDYDEEYEQDDVHNHSEDPLASAMLLLAKAITQNFSNPTNNHLRASSNTRNQAVVQGDRVNIQSRNSGNVGRNNRRAYVQEEVVEGMNATNETANVQRIVRTPTPGNTSTGQCYNCGGKGHYARNCPKPRVRDSKYFMEQMLLAKQDEAGVILTDEQNDFLFADASRMEEIEELSANICLMARIQPADQNSDDEPSYESAFVSEVQSSSINENDEQMYPTHTKIINSTIDDDQINSNIQFDSVKGNVNSGSVEKDTHVYDQCALETLARNAYAEAAKQQRFAQKVQQQNMTLTSQIEMYKERNRVLENITKDNNYLKEFLEADERAKRVQKQAESQLKMSENEDKYHDTILDLEEKLKKNVDLFLKIGNSLQAMFMLGPKPLSVYNQQLKHGLGYLNPYTLEIPLNVRDSEETLEDAFKSQ